MKLPAPSWLLFVALGLGPACTNQNRISGSDSGGSGGSSGAAGGSGGGAGKGGATGGAQPGFGGFGGFAPGSDGGPPAETCSDAAKLVYVVSDENHLYTFAPNKLPDVAAAFTDLGLLGCSDPGDTVNSMAVDRHGTAYVNYASGKIFTVDTRTLACTDTNFVPGQAEFSPNVSLGFSADAPGSSAETLFVSDNTGDDTQDPDGKGLARLDLTRQPPQLIPLGPFTGDVRGGRCELTGTGDGKLYGFFTTRPAHLAAIDKASAATPAATALPEVDASTGGYAFSFWGGSFWFYTASDTATTKVTRYDPTVVPPATTVAAPMLPFTIVGAGVSTCAPLTFPPIQ
ncbi:MAG TPA: hypothetical protein VN914_01830 [Polyangia bacterium]|nr:hypothetical protein [Polyangia bacterium]